MADTDHDGLSDAAERRLGTDPRNYDSDGDGFADGSEIGQRKDPLHADPPHVLGARDPQRRPTAEDPDADGLPAMQEDLLGTDPNNSDSDGDGLGDFVEFLRGTDPLSPFSDGTGDTTTDLDDIAPPRPAPPRPAPARVPASPSDAVPDPTDPGGSNGTPAIDPDVELLGLSARTAFIDAARAQIGDRYRFGAETDLNDPDPSAFDSSELVQWAAAQAGIDLPDGSWKQYQFLHQSGSAVSVDDALRTPGALVFGFSSDPLASDDRPTRAYVAISLGDGRVIDVSERAGEVREMEPGNFFTHAAVIPQMMEDLDSDGDGMLDVDERVLETDPFDPSDGPYAPPRPQDMHPLDPRQPDTDGDGMLDIDEIVLGRDPNDPSDGTAAGAPPASEGTEPTTEPTQTTGSSADPAAEAADAAPAIDPTDTLDPFASTDDRDGDGLTDGYENLVGTNPNRADSDNDGLTDRIEIEHVMDPLEADGDHDGLVDGEEAIWGTYAFSADSDSDGMNDLDEINANRDPMQDDSIPTSVPDASSNDLEPIDDAGSEAQWSDS
jgi:cell wall-associated NlpC family hydrolase